MLDFFYLEGLIAHFYQFARLLVPECRGRIGPRIPSLLPPPMMNHYNTYAATNKQDLARSINSQERRVLISDTRYEFCQSVTCSDQNRVNDYFTLSTVAYFDWFPLYTRRRKLIVLHFNMLHILTGIHFQSEKQSKCES